jgi:integrase
MYYISPKSLAKNKNLTFGLPPYTLIRCILKAGLGTMAGKQAKILTARQLERVLAEVRQSRYPERDRAIVLLSLKAGLRAGEIAKLTWSMVVDANGRVGDRIELHDAAAKQRRGRVIPMHPMLKTALSALRNTRRPSLDDPVILSERDSAMRANSSVNWFADLYRRAGFDGCSSHSGRRTFITRAARLVHRTGGSLRDVQQLAGHASIEMTQRYIDGDSRAKRALVRLV